MIARILQDTRIKRQHDAEVFKTLDNETCMICRAQGPDKRDWFLECMYAVDECVPEALDLHNIGVRGYYLRLCKECRGAFLRALKEAADKRRETSEERLSGYCAFCDEPVFNEQWRYNQYTEMTFCSDRCGEEYVARR